MSTVDATTTPGGGAWAILGGRLRLALNAGLCAAVTGESGLLADPALVCDVAIGTEPGAGGVLLRSRVRARRVDGGEPADVLDWRFVGVAA